MKGLLVLAGLITSLQCAYSDEPRTIVHSLFFQDGKLVNGQIYGTLHLTGLIDRPTATDWGDVQFRLHSSEAWQSVTPTSSPVRTSLRSSNWRRYSVIPVTTTGIEFRVCQQNEPCSVSYEFKPQPIFGKYIPVSSSSIGKEGIVTPFRRNLRFGIRNHGAGNMQFQIGKLNTVGELSYQGYVPAEIPKGCPETAGDPYACEVRIPDAILTVPGIYTLSATSDYGSSQNTLQFEVASVFKIISIVPEQIRQRLQSVLTFHFGGGQFRPSDIDVTLTSPTCRNRKIPVHGPGNDQVDVIIPQICMPILGMGDLDFEVKTREGVQKIKVPYDLRQ